MALSRKLRQNIYSYLGTEPSISVYSQSASKTEQENADVFFVRQGESLVQYPQ